MAKHPNIPVSLDAMLPGNEDMLRREVAKALRIKPAELGSFQITRKSVDARKKGNVHFVVTVELGDGEPSKNLVETRTMSGRCSRPIIVGAGPAGLFCALSLARAGLRPLVIERGKPVEERMRDVEAFASGGPLNPDSNVQFGEGGAGTFSDGKLNTGTKSPHIRTVLEEFVSAGAPADILVDAKPHIGTDLLPDVVRGIRKAIVDAGGEFSFETQLTGLLTKEGNVTGVEVLHLPTNDDLTFEADTVVLAIGHSARDTFQELFSQGIAMERKPFAVGVRIEHLQSEISEAQYGKAAGHPVLGAADYKLAVHNADGRGVYTFCMCPGGTVVAASSEPGHLCVNGMSANARDGVNSNSALLVSVTPEDLPGSEVLEGVRFQGKMEKAAYRLGMSTGLPEFTAPAQTVGDFLTGDSGNPSKSITPTYPRGVAWVDLHECLPGFVSRAMEEALPALDRKLHGFADAEAVMTGVEPRSSSPVRIVRDGKTLQSLTFESLYPAGEGAGYAGGIMSAAVDGLRVAEAVIARIAGNATTPE